MSLPLTSSMASTYPSYFLYCSSSSSIPNSTSTTRFSLSCSQHSILKGCNGISLNRGWFDSRICAKFDKFQGEPPQDDPEDFKASSFQVLQEDGDDNKEEDDRYNMI